MVKEIIFKFLWAALCAWVAVWLLSKTGLQNASWLSWLHSFGIPLKKVLFFVLFVVFWITGWHKITGPLLLKGLGLTIILVVGGMCIYYGYHLLLWLASCL